MFYKVVQIMLYVTQRWIACRLLFSYGSSFGLHVQDFFLLTKKVAVVTTNVSLLLSSHVDMKISIVKSLNKNMVNNVQSSADGH